MGRHRRAGGVRRRNRGEPWADALAVGGLPDGLLPDAVPAGRPVGCLAHGDVPPCAAGAVLSVAGHDHPVAALGVGAALRSGRVRTDGIITHRFGLDYYGKALDALQHNPSAHKIIIVA